MKHIFKCADLIPKAILALMLLTFSVSSCKKFVEIEAPKTQTVTASVYENDGLAISAMHGVYSKMIDGDGFASGYRSSLMILAGLSADEFSILNAQEKVTFFTNSLEPTNSDLKGYVWQQAYETIYRVNAIIEGLSMSSGVTESVKKQLAGEAKFIRAFYYFYLANLFGDVPLVTSTDYRINSVMPRTSVTQVYQQVVTDLQEAQNLLPGDYSLTANERTRPNKGCAIALLARVYLYTENWANAEIEASKIISNSALYSLPGNLNASFINTSTEAIWQIKPVAPGMNTWEGALFNIAHVALSNQILNAFEANDDRKSKWVKAVSGNFMPNKYKIFASGQAVTEYSMVLRLAEQFLIRAEARARQNKLTGSNSAESDINVIRNRALLGNTTATTQSQLLLAIEQERRVELFSEWGHRWLDLKRTSRADAVLGPLKAPNWQPTDVLYPIPQTEININPNLIQNIGY